MANYFEDDVRIVIAPRMAVGPQGANAPEVQVQYSSDGSSWHDTPQSGDMYLRFSTDGGDTWGNAVRLAEMAIDDQITDGVTDRAPSQNAVYDALAQKVTGPASATDGGIAVFNGTSGKLLKDFGYLPRQPLTGDITVTVGSGGDYATINAALEDIVAKYYPVYLSGGNCPRVTINLLSGFVMSEQVLVESLDLSWITITGEDSETVIDRSALVAEFEGRYPAFGVTNGGFLPIIGQLFNMDATGNGTYCDGVYIRNISKAIVLPNAGVKNASVYGMNVYSSSFAVATSSNFSGAGEVGIRVFKSSIVNAGDAIVSGAGGWGMYALRGSIINATGADASSCGSGGFSLTDGAIISATNATGTLVQSANTVTGRGIIFQF